MKGKKSSQ